MKYKYEPIPCGHKPLGLSTRMQINNHHPLTKKQIDELIAEALISDNPSKQQVRLVQAIPGIKCPYDIEGPIATLKDMLGSNFVAALEAGEFSEAHKELFYRICQAK